MATLTIRNVTSTSIDLKLVERFEAPSNVADVGGFANITKNFTNLMRSPQSPSSAQLATNSESFKTEDVAVHLDAFVTSKTDVRIGSHIPNETVRLTFETEGERHRFDVSSTTFQSIDLDPLTPNPRFKYTAICLPEQSYIALFSSANLEAWMRELKDETPLSALSIPGTHNAPACYRALPSVRCQAVSPKLQLDNGVRFFDIRVQVENPKDLSKDGLILVHSVFPISLTGTKYFRDLINEILAFLEKNPSETLIMSVKREGTGDGTDAQLGRILKDHYAGDLNRWFTAPHIPALGEARGKIVLMRRFGIDDDLKKEWNGTGWAINAETWRDNTENDTCPSGDVCVQDFYQVMETESIEKKIEFSEQHLERAGVCVCTLSGTKAQDAGQPPPKQPFFLNFLSASNFWKAGLWPEKIAAKVNPSVVNFLCTKHNEAESGKPLGDGSTGIVVCDWVGNNGNWDLVRCVVGMNAMLEQREKSM